jgi:hypothetical protein
MVVRVASDQSVISGQFRPIGGGAVRSRPAPDQAQPSQVEQNQEDTPVEPDQQ